VPHAEYRNFTNAELTRLVKAGGLVADLKGMWRDRKLPAGLKYWTL
jgi:UDP-N-acetyl-D-galactosamine dehydrogenase